MQRRLGDHRVDVGAGAIVAHSLRIEREGLGDLGVAPGIGLDRLEHPGVLLEDFDRDLDQSHRAGDDGLLDDALGAISRKDLEVVVLEHNGVELGGVSIVPFLGLR